MTWRRLAISTLWLAALAVLGCAPPPPPPAPPSSVVLLPARATHLSSPYPAANTLGETRSVGHGVGRGHSPQHESVEDSPLDDDQVADTDPSALSDFEADLEPYGEWFEDPYYGTVWVPYEQAVGTEFVPYLSAGRWALAADDQWLWVSNYPFGAIVFHYGRWVQTHHHGWVWIPGRRYAHAWVTFRVSDEPYIGWAPMPPRYVWRAGRAVMLSELPSPVFVFVPYRYAFFTSVHSYAIHHPWHVRHWMMHSWVYWPTGAVYGYYYCPPVHYIPRRARPSGRRAPEPLASQRVRYREPAMLAPGRDATAAARSTSRTRTRDLVRPSKGSVAPLRDKARRLSIGETPEIDGRPSIARPSSDASTRTTTSSVSSTQASPSAIESAQAPRRSGDALSSKRDAAGVTARRPARSFELSPSADLRPMPPPKSLRSKRDATDLRGSRSGPERRTHAARPIPSLKPSPLKPSRAEQSRARSSESKKTQRKSANLRQQSTRRPAPVPVPRQARREVAKPRVTKQPDRPSQSEERDSRRARREPLPKAKPAPAAKAKPPKKPPSSQPRATPRPIRDLRKSAPRPKDLRPKKR